MLTNLRFTVVLILLLWVNAACAQSPNDWWFFGGYAGVHFTPSGPVADTNGALETIEGCATVSDAQGDLLFYTDGKVVYNVQHDTMPNGDSLFGNGSSTQSSVIVPYPGYPSRYCIFTASGCTGGSIGFPLGQATSYLFAYSVVDMTLDNGLGDVLVAEKNIILFDSSAEKITATTHANGSDLWVIGNVQNTNTYYAHHLSSGGVIDTVVSNVGDSVSSCAGYMLANHKGNQIAKANSTYTQVFDFDQATGELQPNPLLIDTVGYVYGLHFSPNDSLLYTASGSSIMQFDLTSSNVVSSGIHVNDSMGNSGVAALMEGPDGQLYVARVFRNYLSKIEFPNMPGVACNFVDTAVLLNGRQCTLGLPNTVAAGVFAIDAVKCFGVPVEFIFDSTLADSVLWNFGDSNSSSNTSTAFSTQHTFTDTGEFVTTLIFFSGNQVDTLIRQVTILPRQTLELGPDTSVCSPNEVVYNIEQAFSTYLWQDGSTADTFLVNTDTTLRVTLFGVCDTLSDSVTVSFVDTPLVDLGPDTVLCGASSFDINAFVTDPGTLEWSSGVSNTTTLTVTASNYYSLQVTNACGSVSDSIRVTLTRTPSDTLLPNDTVQCFNDPIVLQRPIDPATTYRWSDGSSTERYVVDSSQIVWLEAFNPCGASTDTMNIVFNDELVTELGEDTTICTGDSIALVATDSMASFLWNTGDTTDTVFSDPLGRNNYIVTITRGACQRVESRFVLQDDVACPNINCAVEYGNTFTPNGDGVNDRFQVWSDCDIFRFDMAIYNRWGQLVNYTTNVSFGWDGFINGEPAPEGVYYFVLEYKDLVVVDADRQITNGSFTLLR